MPNYDFICSLAGPSHQISIPEDEQLVSAENECIEVLRNGARKSVSIVLPSEGNG